VRHGVDGFGSAELGAQAFLASVANVGCDLRIGCIEIPSRTAAPLHERTGGRSELVA
jgi:hypothetical protein